jgi:hypothetical protein
MCGITTVDPSPRTGFECGRFEGGFRTPVSLVATGLSTDVIQFYCALADDWELPHDLQSI